MSYKVLALKYRPQTFAEVVGQQATLMALQHALDNNQVHHAYLFTGTRGVGKTTLARILAKSINCERGVSSRPCDTCEMCTSITQGDNVDVIEIDAASRTRVEDTRDLLDNVPYAPVRARFKVYIIDEVHMLSNHSFNALLKTLEEPPEHVKFILATTDPQKLPVTVLSRCLQFHLRSLSIEQITQHLANVLQQENINFEAAALVTVAECANGSMRDALSLLEQVIAFGERNVTAIAAQQILGTAIRAQTLELLEKIIIADARQAIKIVRDLAANNADFNQVLKLLQTLIHQLALVQIVPDGIAATVADSAQLVRLSEQVTALDLQLFYQAALLGVRDLPYAPDIVIGFEMIVLRMLAFQPVIVNDMHINEARPIPKPMPSPKPLPTPIPVPVPKPEAKIAHTAPTTRDWAQIIPQLNLAGLTKVLAEHCTIVSWQDDTITLVLHEAQKPLLNPKHVERIQTALRSYLNNNVILNLTVGQVTAETPAAQGQRLQQAAQTAAETNIRSDQHIQQLEQTFAAKIAEINVHDN
jgi:DNA polymerase-3 subunit gamma/tau